MKFNPFSMSGPFTPIVKAISLLRTKTQDGLLKQIQIIQQEQNTPYYVISNVEHNLLVVKTEIIATKQMIEMLDMK